MCTDVKDGSFPWAVVFIGRNLHFTGLQSQGVGIVITLCPSVCIGERVRHTNGVILMRPVKLFTWIIERGRKYLPLLIALIRPPTYCIHYHKYPVGRIRPIVSATTGPVVAKFGLKWLSSLFFSGGFSSFFSFTWAAYQKCLNALSEFCVVCCCLCSSYTCRRIFLLIFNSWNVNIPK